VQAPADVETTGNVADLVRAAARTDPAHPALIEVASGRRLSWGELDAAVDAAVSGLQQAGLSPGDRVVVRLAGTVEYCVSVFAVLRAGGVLVPTARRAAPRELDEVLADSGAQLLIAGTDDEDATRAAAAGVRLIEPPGPASGPVPPVSPQAGGGPSAGSASGGPSAGSAGGEDLAVLAFTSGSSGIARGVMLSHRALLSNVAQCAALRPAPVTPADTVLLALPLFHVYGLGPGLLQVANAGATAVLAGRFDAAESLAVLSSHRVTTVVGVPTMYRAWLRLGAESPRGPGAESLRGPGAESLRRAFATVRLLTSGAAPLEASLAIAFADATGLGIFEGYGLTETGPVLTSTLVGGSPKPGSVGRPLPGVELRLVHPDGTPLGAGSDPDEDDEDDFGTGLVAARGPNLLTGYWPDAANGPDADGWFRTGDVGYLDADGDLRLIDRASDLIIVNGFNVYPHEVERALLEHPAIAQAAVVGVPHELSGETVRAVLVLADDASLTRDELDAHCAYRLARYKIPTSVEVVAELPTTPTGKLSRRALRTLTGTPLP
jgi:long-chain acyl-CoA synthetase